ncbi:MAG: proline dehydrogenase family protein [Bacteroidetes bacterium]|nr:proline dehydrogenase family protein [Bacteroidota bacterium]MBS1629698.1 proline dehydrogenase family protein [Bacteroidota bacterium]
MPVNFDNTEIAFQYRSDKELRQAAFLFSSMASPALTKIGTALTRFSIKAGLPVKSLIKSTIYRQFCGGETLDEAAATARQVGPYGVNIILDYSVEGKEGEAEFDHAVQEVKKAIRSAATQRPYMPFVSVKVTGYARFALLEKWHSGSPLSEAEEAERQRVRDRIEAICQEAAAQDIMVLIDAEESWIQKPVDELADAVMAKYNRGKALVFNTFQLYCHDRLEFLKTSAAKALANGYFLGSKMVRGAYMEKERARAAEMGYPSPIQPDKAATDRDYDAAVRFCLENLDHVATFIGTHNEQSCASAVALMQERKIPTQHPQVWFSQLFGMSDNISFNLAHEGFHIAKYLPYGPVKDVVPYLMRRAEENTSVAGQTGRELALIRKELKRRKH